MAERPINILQSLYDLAQDLDAGDPGSLNPSLESLRKITSRYEIREPIAVGGIKQIYRAFDRRTHRELAMARMRPQAGDDLIDPFIHEAWLTARLDHPCIVNIHDLGIGPDGRPFFTMDLKRGQSLAELLRKLAQGDAPALAAYPLKSRLEIFVKATDALAYAHSRNVVHLDLKPANIQVGPFGEVLVFDWGLGKVLGGDDPLEFDRLLLHPDLFASTTPEGKLSGTLGYMAPEQLELGNEVDEKTDVFGLGCILYELLTLCPAFPADEPTDPTSCLRRPLIPPHERHHRGAVPRGLSEVAMKALAPHPQDRYASVVDLGSEVRRYLMGYAPDAEQAGLGRQLQLLVARNRRFSLTVFLATLALVIGTAVSFRALSKREQVALRAQQQAEDNLMLYRSGLMQINDLSDKLVDNLVEIARQYQFQRKPNLARSLISTALEQSPQNPRLRNALAEHELVSFRFDAASKIFESIPPGLRQAEYHGFALQARELKPNDSDSLDGEAFVDLLHELADGETWAGRSSFATRLVLYDQPGRTDMKERAQIIEALLKVLNPDWREGWFIYNEATASLKVGGPGLSRISNNSSVLQGLNLRELDISHSMVTSLRREIGSPIEVLHINHTPLRQRFAIERLPSLKHLYLSPEQHLMLERAILPPAIKITLVPH